MPFRSRALLDHLQRRGIVGLFDLQEGALDLGLVRRRQHLSPVDDALADDGADHLAIGVGDALVLQVLDVQRVEAVGIFGQIGDRIGAAGHHPADIHLHLHQRRIGVLEQIVIGRDVADLVKFDIVIVIGEGQAGLLAGRADLVEGVGILLPAIQARPRHDGGAVQRIEREGTGDVLDPDRLGFGDGGVQLLAQVIAAGMDAFPGDAQAVIELASGPWRTCRSGQVGLHMADAEVAHLFRWCLR